MWTFHCSNCADDREKIYALMGLCDDSRKRILSNGDHHGMSALGYKSGADLVYWQLALRTLRGAPPGPWSVVRTPESAALFPPRDLLGSKLPWWVPDWRVPRRGYSISQNAPVVRFSKEVRELPSSARDWKLVDDRSLVCRDGSTAS